MQFCNKCKAQLPDRVKFCTKCGADLSKQKVVTDTPKDTKFTASNVCPKCRAMMTDKTKFCTKCGTKMPTNIPKVVASDTPNTVPNEPPQNLCPKCGAVMTDKTKFCTKCGAEMAKKLVKAAKNAGKLINGIMEFTSQASDDPGEMVISNFKSKMKF